jgi:hypothetical protein
MTTADVRSFALSLPETVEGLHGRRAAFLVARHLFVVLQDADGEILVWVEEHEREALGAEAPEAFSSIPLKKGGFVTNWMTVRLAAADPPLVREVIEDGWRRFAPKRALAALGRPSGR